jgi:hypothetical protein
MTQKIQQTAESLYDEGYLTYYESCSLETIENSIDLFVQMGIMVEQNLMKGQHGEIDQIYFTKPDERIAELLKSLFERMSFFKPIVTFNSGIIKF